MRRGSGRRRGCAALAAAAVPFALAGCTEQPAPDPVSDEVTLGSLGEVPDLTMIDTEWETYRTAVVTGVDGGPGRRTLDVTYDGGDPACSGLAGYAVTRTSSEAQVTLVVGAAAGCDAEPAVDATTVVPLDGALGSLQPVVSELSEASLPIGE